MRITQAADSPAVTCTNRKREMPSGDPNGSEFSNGRGRGTGRQIATKELPITRQRDFRSRAEVTGAAGRWSGDAFRTTNK